VRFFVVWADAGEHVLLEAIAFLGGSIGHPSLAAAREMCWSLFGDGALRFDGRGFHLTDLGKRLLAAGPDAQVWHVEAPCPRLVSGPMIAGQFTNWSCGYDIDPEDAIHLMSGRQKVALVAPVLLPLAVAVAFVAATVVEMGRRRGWW
jgi:hypothetical protein